MLYGDFRNACNEDEPRFYEDLLDYEAVYSLFLEVRSLASNLIDFLFRSISIDFIFLHISICNAIRLQYYADKIAHS